MLAQLIFIWTWQKTECKNKIQCKICQADNKSGLYTSFLSSRQNSSFPFFFKIKQQETTYTVRFFPLPFHPPPTTEMNSASAQCTEFQVKPLKTADAQHFLQADPLRNHSKKKSTTFSKCSQSSPLPPVIVTRPMHPTNATSPLLLARLQP